MTFCYDCPPHEAGMSTFRRLSMEPNCVVDRFALPLRVDAQVKKFLAFGSTLAAPIGNLVLRASRWPALRSMPEGLEISKHAGPFGEEFSKLDNAVRDESVIRSQRSAAHLNWRFREDPLQKYHVWTTRRRGELLGFVVFRLTDTVITIVDLFGAHPHLVAGPLLVAMIEQFQGSHQTIEAVCSQGSDWIIHLVKLGFRRRSQVASVVAYAMPKSDMSKFLQTKPKWSFLQADVRA
jgi:hypothetical protein